MSQFNRRIFVLLMLFCYQKSANAAKKPIMDYCKINCNREKHTVCKRDHWCGAIKDCTMVESDLQFREKMIKDHNSYRQMVASGQEKGPYNNTGAKNMNAISYDLELEYVAACWTNQCPGLQHDKCRDVSRFAVGQNIYEGINVNEVERAVPVWYDEIEFMYDGSWIDKKPASKDYPNDNKQRGHFTLLVWATLKYVGCARAMYGPSNKRKRLLICNYGPGGNMVGEPIYKRAFSQAEIASECQKKNQQYNALCGDIEPIPTEQQWAKTNIIEPNLVCVTFLLIVVIYSLDL